MKIIKNLKYFLMLGCLSFATFTFAETTANQNADKQAVQKQLSKKLNDLSIHIETLENMLKTINVNDWNDMKNRLDSIKDSIDNQYNDIENLKNRLDSIDVNYFDDVKDRLSDLEYSIKGAHNYADKAFWIAADAQTNAQHAVDLIYEFNTTQYNNYVRLNNSVTAISNSVTRLEGYRYVVSYIKLQASYSYRAGNNTYTSNTVVRCRVWNDSYIEQVGEVYVPNNATISLELPYAYRNADSFYVLASKTDQITVGDGNVSASPRSYNSIYIEADGTDGHPNLCTFYAFGYQ